GTGSRSRVSRANISLAPKRWSPCITRKSACFDLKITKCRKIGTLMLCDNIQTGNVHRIRRHATMRIAYLGLCAETFLPLWRFPDPGEPKEAEMRMVVLAAAWGRCS